MLEWLSAGEGSLLVCRWPPFSCVLKFQKARALVPLPSIIFEVKASKSFKGISENEGPILMTYSNPSYFPKARYPQILYLGLGLQHKYSFHNILLLAFTSLHTKISSFHPNSLQSFNSF